MLFTPLLLLLVLFLIRYFSRNDRGSKEPASALWAAAGFGALALLIAAGIEGLLIPNSWLHDDEGN